MLNNTFGSGPASAVLTNIWQIQNLTPNVGCLYNKTLKYTALAQQPGDRQGGNWKWS